MKTISAVISSIAILSVAPASVCAQSEPARADWNVRDHLKPSEIIVQSHRGAGELAPENTLEAFELGWKLGTYPEADVRTTTDGVIVAFHDANFKRVVKNVPSELAEKGVKDITWDQLKKLDVGSWMGQDFLGHRVCTMEDIFEIMAGMPDRHLYLDIKQVDLKQLADQVKKHKINAQVVLASPRHDELVEWKKMVPESDTLLWIGGKTEAEQKKKFEDAKARNFEGLTQVQIHTHLTTASENVTRESVNPFTGSDEFLIESGNVLRKRGILYQTLPYEGSTPGVFHKLLDLGLMSFSTDHPKVTMQALEDYYKLPRSPEAATAKTVSNQP